MTLKTYLFPEVAANGEITEWVPADVARELLAALRESDKTLCILQVNVAHANKTDPSWDGVWTEIEHIRMENESAFKKSCGEL